MARTFDGVDDQLRCAIGALTGADAGGETYAFVARRTGAATAWHGIMALLDSAGTWRAVVIEGSGDAANPSPLVFYSRTITGIEGRPSPSNLWATADGWCLFACTKPAGAAAVRFHRYQYATGTWTHENSAATLGDAIAAPGAGGSVQFGALEGSDFMAGDLAAAAAWDRVLTDTELENLAHSLIHWYASAPIGLWLFDQQATDQTVADATGGGANQTSLTGTAVATSSLPGLSYGHDITVPGTATAGGPSTVDLTPATATLAAAALDPQPQPVTVALTPATTTAVPIAPTPVPQPVTVTLTPATATTTAVPATATPGPVTANLTPAAATLTAIPLGAGAAPGEATLTPATATITAVALTPTPGPVTITLTAATAAAAAIQLAPAPPYVPAFIAVEASTTAHAGLDARTLATGILDP